MQRPARITRPAAQASLSRQSTLGGSRTASYSPTLRSSRIPLRPHPQLSAHRIAVHHRRPHLPRRRPPSNTLLPRKWQFQSMESSNGLWILKVCCFDNAFNPTLLFFTVASCINNCIRTESRGNIEAWTRLERRQHYLDLNTTSWREASVCSNQRLQIPTGGHRVASQGSVTGRRHVSIYIGGGMEWPADLQRDRHS